MVHFASDAAFAFTSDCRLVAWNARAEDLFGYTAQEVVGRSCYRVLRAVLPDGQPLCTPSCPAIACFGRGSPSAAQSCLAPHKDGHWMGVALSSMAVPNAADHGQPVAIVFVRPLQHVLPTPASTSILRIFTFGRFGLAVGSQAVNLHRWERKQALTLLKCLVNSLGHAVHRGRLTEWLWPEAPERRAWERLKVTVCSLRRELRRAGVEEEVIGTADEAYFLRREAVWLDTEAFDTLVRQGDALVRRNRLDEALRCYRDAEELYRGGYLEEDLYADWCAEARERLREVYLQAMEKTASIHAAQGDLAQAVQVCRQALSGEPCREGLQRALMLYIWQQGRRDEALVQYQSYAQVLADTLGVEPVPETQQLHYQILHSSQWRPSEITY